MEVSECASTVGMNKARTLTVQRLEVAVKSAHPQSRTQSFDAGRRSRSANQMRHGSKEAGGPAANGTNYCPAIGATRLPPS